MIENDQQYFVTQGWVKRFDKELKSLGSSGYIHPLLREAQQDALVSQREELEAEMLEYRMRISPRKPQDEKWALFKRLRSSGRAIALIITRHLSNWRCRR